MPQFIQQFTHELIDDNGVIYTASVYGEPRADGTWEGWIEFNPLNSSQPTLRTPRETTQPDRSALAYWASGLEPLYLEGAFERAKRS